MINEQVHPGKALRRRALAPLPLGKIRPQGWLADQLRMQADGITGQLDEFWPDVAESGWIGGNAEGWERAPYWLDGAVPLAYVTDNARLKAKVKRWIDEILTRQHEDGWLGPVKSGTGRYRAYDPWPVFVVLKAFVQYYDATADERIPAVMTRFFRKLERLLGEQPLFDWGRFRWGDLLLSIYWLYERTGEAWLLELAETAKRQGFDWRAHFADFALTQKTPRERADLISHVVNNAMAVKMPAIWWLQSADAADRDSSLQIIEQLERYHGQVTGVFSGDEHLAGRSPSQGTELCAVVEYLFSLETLISILGTPQLADRLERIAYNALPGTFTPDLWAHQYDQQANQVSCRVGEHVWTTNGRDANTFGLAPHYGCCTANLHQGWPKLTAHLWMRAADGGLVAPHYAPCTVSARTGDGTDVTIDEETDYPFGETIRFCVRTARPTRFALSLRIPAWVTGAELHVAGRTLPAEPGSFARIEREWSDGDQVELRLPMTLTCECRNNGAVTLVRGPLVFSLKIGEAFSERGRLGPAVDYEIEATTPWNYALELDCDHPERSVSVKTQPVGPRPFDPSSPPVTLLVWGRRVSEWGLQPGTEDAEPPPPSPVESREPREQLTLIPYGSAHLRITEFPVLA